MTRRTRRRYAGPVAKRTEASVGRTDVERTGVVRVVIPCADDLTPRQREAATAAGVDLDTYAQRLAHIEERSRHGRRAEESDAAHVRRLRHLNALALAKTMVLRLEALRPIAETDGPVAHVDARDLEATLVAVETAAAGLTRGGTDAPVRRRIDAVRRSLDTFRALDDKAGGKFDRATLASLARGVAIAMAPELVCIRLSDWKRAIKLWPGCEAERPRGGGIRYANAWTWAAVEARAAKSGPDWADVVFVLLHSGRGELTSASTPRALRDAWRRSRGHDEHRLR